jgi:heme O synthase-like polyprenyltransferase
MLMHSKLLVDNWMIDWITIAVALAGGVWSASNSYSRVHEIELRNFLSSFVLSSTILNLLLLLLLSNYEIECLIS